MTEWYTHFDANEFRDVREAQEALIRPDKAKNEQPEKTGKPSCPVIPFTGNKTADQKRA
jgi:hypothetical protein